MSAVKVSAGIEHIIKVGKKEYRITLRPREVRYLPGLREALAAVPVVIAKSFVEWAAKKRERIELRDVLEMTDAFVGLREIGFKVELSNVLSTVDTFLKL